MNIYCDIDNTICTHEANYRDAKPLTKRIAFMNRLYDEGHSLTYWTARGTETGIVWRLVTERQLKAWGVRYTALLFGKPAFDILIDDKVLNSEWLDIMDEMMSNGEYLDDKVFMFNLSSSEQEPQT